MIDSRIKMLITTVNKLYRRGARRNIQKVLVKTHTADIAEVIDHLETGENLEVLRLEPSLEKRAEILSYLKPETQQELLFMMEEDEAQNIVTRMESDDAADLLGHLPEDFSSKILKLMEREDSEEVTDLMGYPEDSAGGIMSSDFLVLNQDLKVSEAILQIQEHEDDATIMFYLYVIDENEQLVGVLSLKQLLLAKKNDLLREIVTTDVISVSLETDQQEVAQLVERYDFLAVPVVDDAKKLMGVITVDDVLDVIREEVEEDLMALGRAGIGAEVTTFEHFKARWPWLFLTFLGGVVCFYLVYQLLGPSQKVWWYFAALLPMVFSMGATAGNQAVSIALGVIRGERMESIKIFKHWLREVRISLPLALFFGVLSFLLAYLLIGDMRISLILTSALTLQILLAIYFGSTIPLVLQRIGIDPAVAAIPLYTVITDIIAVIVLFGLGRLFLGAF